jgi:hypothetical protein
MKTVRYVIDELEAQMVGTSCPSIVLHLTIREFALILIEKLRLEYHTF